MASESAEHQRLKRLAAQYLLRSGCAAVGVEVTCPIHRFRLDAAGYMDRLPEAAPEHALTGADPGFEAERPRTAIIECKRSRADFIRDAKRLDRLLLIRERLVERRSRIEQTTVRRVEPQLRRSGSFLFPEFESWDFAESRVGAYQRTVARLDRIDRQVHGQTKFSRLTELASADFLYLAAPAGLIRRSEIPDSWGLLECDPEHLTGSTDLYAGGVDPVFWIAHTAKPGHSTPRARSRLLRNIAVAHTRQAFPAPRRHTVNARS